VWSTASLELADTPEGRLLALRALHRGPPVTVLPNTLSSEYNPLYLAFSPSGEWLATGFAKTLVWPRDGGDPIHIEAGPPYPLSFLADDLLVTAADSDHPRYWSMPDGVELRGVRPTPGWVRGARGNVFFTYSAADEHGLEWLHRWPLEGGSGWPIGGMEPWSWYLDDIDSTGTWLAYPRGKRVFVRSLDDWSQPPHVLGEHNSEITNVTFDPNGESVAALDSSGLVGIWPANGRSDRPAHTLQTRGLSLYNLCFDPNGTRIATHATVEGLPTASYWDLMALEGAAPITLMRSETGYANPFSLAWHPSGNWLVQATAHDVGFWPVARPQPVVLEHGGRVMDLIITPDGSWLVTVSSPGETQPGQVRAWPLKGQNGGTSRLLLEREDVFYMPHLAVDPGGQRVAVQADRSVVVLPLFGGSLRELSGKGWSAFSPDGRRLATAPPIGKEGGVPLKVWDLESEEARVVGEVRGRTIDLRFLDGNRLLWAGSDRPHHVVGEGGGEMVFDLAAGTRKVVSEDGSELLRTISPGGKFMLKVSAAESGSIECSRVDLESGETQHLGRLATHGDLSAKSAVASAKSPVAIDPSGKWVATGGYEDGIVRVGPVTGEEPHRLYGHKGAISKVAFSPDGRWIASCGYDNTARLWQMPDMTKPPFHTLPYDELMAKLRSLTNLRAVPDEESPTGWSLEVGPFPGWERVPEW
jgi:WD40 repeat protein